MFKSSPYYSNSTTCPHWIPISQECYACARHKKREENKFVNCTVQQNTSKNNKRYNHMDTIFKNNNEYIDPNNSNRLPHTNNTSNNNNNLIDRFLDINNRNDVIQSSDLPNVNFYGIDTRNNNSKKDTLSRNSYNLHLMRSMIQPDNRYGNRFYEYKPSGTR